MQGVGVDIPPSAVLVQPPVPGQGLHLDDGGQLFASSHRALLPPVSVRGPEMGKATVQRGLSGHSVLFSLPLLDIYLPCFYLKNKNR